MRSESWLRLMSGFVLVGVFAAGVLFGAGLTRWSRPGPPPPPPPHGPIEAMTRELALDPGQVSTLRSLTDARRGELDGIARDTQARVRDVLLAIEDQMRPHLRPEQVQALEAWRVRRPPPPPHGPPPHHGPPPPGRPGR